MKRYIFFTFLIPLIFNSAQVSAIPSSTFDADSEGWNTYSLSPGGASAVTWNSSGGNPGGNISADDQDAGFWLFQSPATWANDWTEYVDGTLGFDLKVTTTNFSGYNDTTGYPIVTLDLNEAGDGVYLGWFADINPVLDNWTRYLVEINDTNFQVVGSSLTFYEAIQQITGVFIFGDYLDGLDTTFLDNVNVSPIPEPTTMLLFGAGLIGLAGLGRKKIFRKV